MCLLEALVIQTVLAEAESDDRRRRFLCGADDPSAIERRAECVDFGTAIGLFVARVLARVSGRPRAVERSATR